MEEKKENEKGLVQKMAKYKDAIIGVGSFVLGTAFGVGVSLIKKAVSDYDGENDYHTFVMETDSEGTPIEVEVESFDNSEN